MTCTQRSFRAHHTVLHARSVRCLRNHDRLGRALRGTSIRGTSRIHRDRERVWTVRIRSRARHRRGSRTWRPTWHGGRRNEWAVKRSVKGSCCFEAAASWRRRHALVSGIGDGCDLFSSASYAIIRYQSHELDGQPTSVRQPCWHAQVPGTVTVLRHFLAGTIVVFSRMHCAMGPVHLGQKGIGDVLVTVWQE